LAAHLVARNQQVAEAVELADTLTAEVEALRGQLTDAVATRDALAGNLRDLQDAKQRTELELQRAVERTVAKDLEIKDARTSERDALDRAGRAEGEVGALRTQLAGAQALATERDQLAQQLQDSKQHVEGELQRAAERVARTESAAAEARDAERSALDRAARAEGEAAALREQLAQLTAAFHDSRPSRNPGRRGQREP